MPNTPPLAPPTTDQEAAFAMAQQIWPLGASGALMSPCCGERMRQRRDRPRVFVCRCRREHSVTGGGGAFQYSKLSPLKLWRLAEAYASPSPPSARSMAKLIHVHVETAWQWCVRLKSALACVVEVLSGELRIDVKTWVRLRPPHPRSPPMDVDAHPSLAVPVNHLMRACQVAIAGSEKSVRLEPVDGWMGDYSSRLRDEHGLPGAPVVWPLPEAQGWREQVIASLEVVHRTVSRRWLGRHLQFLGGRAALRAFDAAAFFRAARRCTWAPFDEIRPGACPRPFYDDAAAFVVSQDVAYYPVLGSG